MLFEAKLKTGNTYSYRLLHEHVLIELLGDEFKGLFLFNLIFYVSYSHVMVDVAK